MTRPVLSSLAANVLLLRNNISLQPEGASEIAVSRLLSLVVERLLDSNSSTEVRSVEVLVLLPWAATI